VPKKLTITLDDEVYTGLYEVIGRGRISGFLNDLARPHVTSPDVETEHRALEAEYRAMAADEEREAEAREWIGG
jgi:hypothetical protein